MKAGASVRRLHDGSALVARRVGRAFVPEGRPLAAVIRCGAAAWLASPTLTLLHQSPMWLVGGTCAWCVAAWRAQPNEEQDPAPKPAPTEAAAGHSPAVVKAEFLRLLHDKISGRKGVHLTDLADALHAQGMTEWDAAALRRQYEAYGIPVRSQLYIDGRNRAGIHRDDLSSTPIPQEPKIPLSEPA